jgi:hypothetical protein
MAQDIAGGNVCSASANPGQGISPFRITPENYLSASQQIDQNRVYTAALMGTGPVGDQALEMVLDTSKYIIPKTLEEFRGTMEGFYVTLMIFCGAHNRAVQNFYTNVISQLGHLITILNTRYLPAQHPSIILKIQAYVHLMINDYLSQLLAADVPTALGVPAAGAPATAPDFRRIQERFAESTIQDLTSIPAALVSSVNPRAPAPPANPGVPAQAGGAGGTGGTQSGNAQVTRPDQNPRMRAAWTATGKQSIFTPGSPFYDPNAPNNRKVVMADNGVDEVCIPMLCRGVCFGACRKKHDECSRSEEDRTAAAGGFPIA